MVGFYDFQDAESNATGAFAEDKQIWAVGATMPVAKNVKLSGIYLNADTEVSTEDEGYQVSLAYKGAKASKPGSWGLEAFWYDLGNGVYVDHTNNALEGSYCNNNEGGFEGYSVQASYAFAKNIVGKLEWYDLEAKKSAAEEESLWAQVVFTF